MITIAAIILICWFILLLYWIINWKSVKPAKEIVFRQRNSLWTVLWMVILIIIVSRVFIPSNGVHFFNEITIFPALQPVGLLLTVIGLLIAIVSRKTLADNWSADIELKKDHKLITKGIYKYVRHPIYTGITCMGIGTICAMQSLYSVIFYTVMIGFFIYKLRKEETLLLQHFPKEYHTYMKKTKALIPFIY